MAEWLCSGLQIRVRRFNSDPGLHFESNTWPAKAGQVLSDHPPFATRNALPFTRFRVVIHPAPAWESVDGGGVATKRERNGKWEYVVKRAKLLPRPISLTFHDEAEGDAYVRRLEALLDRGIVPDEYRQAKPEKHRRLRAAIIDYKERHAVSARGPRLLEGAARSPAAHA